MAINWKHYDEEEIKKKAPMVKISAHTNITDPILSGYPVLESLRSFANLCDEVIVVDGGSTDGSLEKIAKIDKVRIIQGEKWERDFDWRVMGKNLQIGYEACQYDWVFHFDVDYIFHEDNVMKLKEIIARSHLPAIELRKVNFVLVNENYFKDHYPLLLFKKQYPVLCYGIGKDEKDHTSATFLRPTIRSSNQKEKDGLYHGEALMRSTVRTHIEDVDVFTYDFTFMNKEQVIEQRNRFDNSLRKFYRQGPVSKETSFKIFVDMMRYRHFLCKGNRGIKLEQHSKFIRERVKSIKPEMFGHSFFGYYLED